MLNRTWTAALAALLLLVIAGTGLARAQKPTPPPPDYFPLPVGAVWEYESTTADDKKSNFSTKVLAVEKQADGTSWVQVAIENPWQTIHEYYSKPAGWVLDHKQVYTKNNMACEFKPVKQFLRNPLSAGQTWNWSGTGMMDVAIEESNTVSGPETVVVPAGKFSAMKVSTHVKQGGQDVQKTYWYANHVGMVKSMTDSGSVKSTTVLLKYRFPK